MDHIAIHDILHVYSQITVYHKDLAIELFTDKNMQVKQKQT